jgi:hypothetical protein
MITKHKMRKLNQFKKAGFKFTLAKHPEDIDRLFVVGVRGEQILRLFAEEVSVAVEYIRHFNKQ